MKTSRKILGTAIAISIAIGAIPLAELPTKAAGGGVGEVTPSTGVKTIMRGTSGIKPQTTTEAQIPNTNPVEYAYTCDKGSSIYFGSYPQGKIEFTSTVANPTPEGTENVDWVEGKDKDNVTKGYYSIDPIEWRVLANKNGEDLFLLSEKNIETVKYYDIEDTVQGEDYPWSTSTIRSWLNGYEGDANKNGTNYSGTGYGENFIGTAFTEKERGKIKTSTITTGENKDYPDVETNSEVEDKIFLLSLGEVTGTGENSTTYDCGFKTTLKPSLNWWYNETENHKAKNSKYIADGCGKTGYTPAGDGVVGYWWLRSPGLNTN